jgi:hypothetical protein
LDPNGSQNPSLGSVLARSPRDSRQAQADAMPLAIATGSLSSNVAMIFVECRSTRVATIGKTNDATTPMMIDKPRTVFINRLWQWTPMQAWECKNLVLHIS